MTGHDWAAIIGAELETGDPPVAYCCQRCGRVLPGLILMVSPQDEAWLQGWLALPEHEGAEVHRVHIPAGAAYVADPRAVDLAPCSTGPAAAGGWLHDAWLRHERLHEPTGPLGRIKIT
jgi:hypothetical protein